jgi:predicted Holliday junction resolvase-like endonuclease
MATKSALLKDLKVGDLKKELEERDMETSGKKAELQERLRQALMEEGDDPDSFVFEVPGAVDMSAVLGKMEENSRSRKEEMRENSRSLEEQVKDNSRSLEEQMKENSRSLKEQIEEQIKENSRNLEEKLEENSRDLEEKLGRNLEVFKGHVTEKMKSLEDEVNNIRQQVAAIQAFEKKSTTQLSTVSDLGNSCNHERDVTQQAEAVRIQMKTPQFETTTIVSLKQQPEQTAGLILKKPWL